jgi:hypothetical protein
MIRDVDVSRTTMSRGDGDRVGVIFSPTSSLGTAYPVTNTCSPCTSDPTYFSLLHPLPIPSSF